MELVYQRRTGSARECVAVFLAGWRLVAHVYSALPKEESQLVIVEGKYRVVQVLPDLRTPVERGDLLEVRDSARIWAARWGLPWAWTYDPELDSWESPFGDAP